MINATQDTMVRELNDDELLAVSGGRVCTYEAGGKCYSFRDYNLFEKAMSHINMMFLDAGMSAPFSWPGANNPPTP